METIALVNQKGGVAKTTTTVNLGIGLAKAGRAVLLLDLDPQGSMTTHLGHHPDDMDVTAATLIQKVVDDVPIAPDEGILRHKEGVDFIPANINLSVLERDLWQEFSPYAALAALLAPLRQRYDYILLDCGPSLGILTLNALAAADSVIVPVQAEFQALRGSQQLLSTVAKARRQLNPQLAVKGILMTMASPTNHARDSIKDVRDTFTGRIRIFSTIIPRSIEAAEASKTGMSIFATKPNNPVALAYGRLTQEVLSLERE